MFQKSKYLLNMRLVGGIGVGRQPKGKKIDPILSKRFPFLVKGRNMLVTPIVCQFGYTKICQHFCPLLWATLLGVEGYDTPGYQVLFRKHLINLRLSIRYADS